MNFVKNYHLKIARSSLHYKVEKPLMKKTKAEQIEEKNECLACGALIFLSQWCEHSELCEKENGD